MRGNAIIWNNTVRFEFLDPQNVVHLNISFAFFCQSSTSGEIEIVQRRDLFKDASQACAQLQLWSSQWGQRPEGQHGYVTEVKHMQAAFCHEGKMH